MEIILKLKRLLFIIFLVFLNNKRHIILRLSNSYLYAFCLSIQSIYKTLNKMQHAGKTVGVESEDVRKVT